jgi:hypothetical protein
MVAPVAGPSAAIRCPAIVMPAGRGKGSAWALMYSASTRALSLAIAIEQVRGERRADRVRRVGNDQNLVFKQGIERGLERSLGGAAAVADPGRSAGLDTNGERDGDCQRYPRIRAWIDGHGQAGVEIHVLGCLGAAGRDLQVDLVGHGTVRQAVGGSTRSRYRRYWFCASWASACAVPVQLSPMLTLEQAACRLACKQAKQEQPATAHGHRVTLAYLGRSTSALSTTATTAGGCRGPSECDGSIAGEPE